MAATLERVTEEAMNLPRHQQLALVEFLLASAEVTVEAESETAWHSEILERIGGINSGKVVGVGYDEVMRQADRLIS